MPTELRDAWPEDEEDSGPPVVERGIEVSARKVQGTQDADHTVNLAYIEAMLSHMQREQSQRLTILTLVFGMLMLCQLNYMQSLRRDMRRLAASPRFL